MKKETFDVFGMTCAACQANVTRAVSKLEGVDSVDVSLLGNSMKVEYNPDQVSARQIEDAVSNIGYEAVSKDKPLNESQSISIQEEWDNRQKHIKEEISEKKHALTASIILLCVLLCFSMLPMLGIFTFLMDMKWMMLSTVVQLVLCMWILFFQRSFFIHGFKALIKRAPNMDSLVAVGSAASFLYGLYGILYMAYGYGVMDHHIIHSAMDALYFEGAAMIVTLVSLGKYLEARSKAKTGDALGKLVDLAPKSAVIEKDGVEIQVAADQVVSGDLVVIRPGQRIPVDGIVASGVGYVDQAAITGESVPVEKQAGDEVMSATINVNGTFKFKATKVGSDTTLAQIIRLVDEAGNSKAPIARLADKVAGYFVPVVMGLSVLTLIGWMIAGKGFGFALSNAICVLVISCPCALGLATPLAIMVSTGKAAEYGVLVKSAASLETLHSIQTVVLDKTGTITNGKPEVVGVQVLDPDLDENRLLALAASAETGSEHPLGKAVVEQAKARNISLLPVVSFEAVSGRGLKAVLKDQTILAGNAAFMEEQHIAMSTAVQEAVHASASRGQTPLLFASNQKIIGVISVADTVRATSAAALKALKSMGIETVMLTGDNAKTAQAIASTLDIDRVISDVLPADKEKVVSELQAQGKKTAMVGDGINDAPALTRADVGIAIGAGTDIAIESADIVLMKDNLMDVVTAVDLSRKTITNIKENLFWAFFYNCLGIPVAMGLLYPAFGWLLNPMWGAAAMSFSSITVCLNALRLRFFKPKNETAAQISSQTAPKAAVAAEEKKAEQIMNDLPEILEKQAETEEQESLVLKVEGMSCENCVHHVTQALEGVPGVSRAEVTLNPGSALVMGKHLDPASLIQAVEAAGYEASLDSDLPDQTVSPAADQSKQWPEVYNYYLGVEGMSCEHCVQHVSEALQKVPGVTGVQVSLADHTATVQTDTPVELSALAKAIESAGYEPILPRMPQSQETERTRQAEETKEKAQPEEASQSVTRGMSDPDSMDDSVVPWTYVFGVEGMSCDHCRHHVQQALMHVPGVISAEVSLEGREAVVKADEPVELEKLAQAVEEAGYTPVIPDPEEEKVLQETPSYAYALEVEGMMCDNCRHHVEQALTALPGIIKAEVNLEEKLAFVLSSQPESWEAMAKVIEEAGYEPVRIVKEEILYEN